jgi:NAD(P)-dependent dehydrogenase (short-subunit alcohol dehydrogenase family)
VLISGGTSGIGLGIAEAFAAAGAKVTATGATDAEVAAASGPATFVRLDVRDNDAVKAFVASLDRIDILVNCAGIIRRAEEHTPEIFDQVMDININGTMRVCTACRPALKASKGAIVSIASVFGILGAPHAPAYGASKGAVIQLTRALAMAYAPDGIRVNALAPGWIETGIALARLSDPVASASLRARVPLDRWGQPEDVARAALFLASPLASYITGVTLPVDGGWIAG